MKLRSLIDQHRDRLQTSELLLDSIAGTLAFLEETLSKIDDDLDFEIRVELEKLNKDIDRLLERIHDLKEVSFVSTALTKKKQLIADILKSSPPAN